MTKNGQNMAKMEKIRNIQMTDNKEDKFFYFPMISMPCTGSGYKGGEGRLSFSFFFLHIGDRLPASLLPTCVLL